MSYMLKLLGYGNHFHACMNFFPFEYPKQFVKSKLYLEGWFKIFLNEKNFK